MRMLEVYRERAKMLVAKSSEDNTLMKKITNNRMNLWIFK